ncbi:hypothetical protein [Fredinandcohnia sp. 179-A 10B2 NHS]|uniref:hypothetical protein n=1 Tax=Fredinandcohnia sp. 179-A 10B2 NHS TaxID=3235176 RepID=UPI0039A3CF13
MKKGILFALAYCLFILLAVGIGLYYSTFDVPKNKAIENVKYTQVTQSFQEALKKEQERVEKRKAAEDPDRWKPSPAFVLTAISIGAIADIVIVILWARHENKKRDESNSIHISKKRITDSKLFWWIIGLGIVQKKNDRLIIEWKYIVAYIVLGFLLKVWISKELF